MSTELAPAPPAYLFGTDEPVAVIEAAARYASALGGVIADRHLYTEFRDRHGAVHRHVNIEGWALLASMLGIRTRVTSQAIPEGFEAHAEALRGDLIIGDADSQCTSTEPNWRGRPDYALRGMAQTRAISRALRIPLGMVMVLAGYDATPAEEMSADPPAEPRGPRATARDALRREVIAEAQARGIEAEALAGLAREAGVLEGDATVAQLRALRVLIAAYTPPEVPDVAPGQLTLEGDTPQ